MKRALFLVAATCLSLASYAQTRQIDSDFGTGSPHSVGLQAGVGWFIFLAGDDTDVTFTTNDVSRDYSVNILSSPAFGLTYDYRINRRFSVGGSLARQRIQFGEFTFVSGDNPPEGGGPTRVNINRNFVSVRGLVYYGPNPRFEMYSGLRLGFTGYGVKAKGVDDATELESDLFDNRTVGGFVLPHVTVIPFGFRGYIDEHFYAGAETMFGSPHFIAAQVGYRF